MKVEIGALVEKEYGQIVKDGISEIAGVEYVFYAGPARRTRVFAHRRSSQYFKALNDGTSGGCRTLFYKA